MNCGDCVEYKAGETAEDIHSNRGECVAPYPGWSKMHFDNGFKKVWAVDGHCFNHADTCDLFKLKLINNVG